MELILDTLASLMMRVGSQKPPQAAALTDPRSVTLSAFALIATLTAGRLVLYALAAQPWGGAEAGLCQWDCEWYLWIVQAGYDPEPRLMPGTDFANWAFFPLYPILASLVGLMTGIRPFWAGTLVSALCFIGFALLSLRYRALTRGPQMRADQAAWLVLLSVYPFSIYFAVPYSESLFLLLTILFLLAIRTGKPTAAGLVTGLLTATRPTGVIAIPYLCLDRLWHARLAFMSGLAVGDRTRILAACALPLALAPLGLALYMSYLYWLTGDALAFSHSQVSWGRHFGINPLKSIYWALARNDWEAVLDFGVAPSQAYSAAFVLPAAFACVWLFWRRLLAEAWLLGGTVLLALLTGVGSLPRFVTSNAVFVLAVGDLVDRISSRAIRCGIAIGAILLQALLLYTWINNSALLM